MKPLKALCVPLLALLALAAFSATAASAHEWTFNGAPIKTPLSVTGTTEALVFKNNAGEQIGCKASRTGTVGPGAAGEMASLALTGCKQEHVLGYCAEGPVTVTAANLPWATTLTTNSKGELVDLIKSDGHGIPTWEITCPEKYFSHENFTLVCTGELKPLMSNEIGGTVDSAFFAQRESECVNFFGGGEKIRTYLELSGTEKIKHSSSLTLKVN
jgi:hypothetical protein